MHKVVSEVCTVAPETAIACGGAEPAAASALESTPASQGEATREAVDLTALVDRVEHDLDLLEEMIELFSTSSAQLLTEMKMAAQRRDCHTITHAAHSLKGALLNMCAEPCAQAALELEMLGRQTNMLQLERNLPRFQQELARVQSALAAISKEICGRTDAGI